MYNMYKYQKCVEEFNFNYSIDCGQWKQSIFLIYINHDDMMNIAPDVWKIQRKLREST